MSPLNVAPNLLTVVEPVDFVAVFDGGDPSLGGLGTIAALYDGGNLLREINRMTDPAEYVPWSGGIENSGFFQGSGFVYQGGPAAGGFGFWDVYANAITKYATPAGWRAQGFLPIGRDSLLYWVEHEDLAGAGVISDIDIRLRRASVANVASATTIATHNMTFAAVDPTFISIVIDQPTYASFRVALTLQVPGPDTILKRRCDYAGFFAWDQTDFALFGSGRQRVRDAQRFLAYGSLYPNLGAYSPATGLTYLQSSQSADSNVELSLDRSRIAVYEASINRVRLYRAGDPLTQAGPAPPPYATYTISPSYGGLKPASMFPL